MVKWLALKTLNLEIRVQISVEPNIYFMLGQSNCAFLIFPNLKVLKN